MGRPLSLTTECFNRFKKSLNQVKRHVRSIAQFENSLIIRVRFEERVDYMKRFAFF